MGRSIRGQGPWDLVKQGLVMVPEGRGVFARMTITENLQMGAFVRTDKEIDADIDKASGSTRVIDYKLPPRSFCNRFH